MDAIAILYILYLYLYQDVSCVSLNNFIWWKNKLLGLQFNLPSLDWSMSKRYRSVIVNTAFAQVCVYKYIRVRGSQGSSCGKEHNPFAVFIGARAPGGGPPLHKEAGSSSKRAGQHGLFSHMSINPFVPRVQKKFTKLTLTDFYWFNL